MKIDKNYNNNFYYLNDNKKFLKIIDLIQTKRYFSKAIQNDNELMNWINSITSKIKDFKLQYKLLWILNDIRDFPKCEQCGKRLIHEHDIRDIDYGYKHCCSISCAQSLLSKRHIVNIGNRFFENEFKCYSILQFHSYDDELAFLIKNFKDKLASILYSSYKKELLNYVLNNSPEIMSNNLYQRIEWIINKRTEFPKCKKCGCNLDKPNNFNYMHYRTYCSNECRKQDSSFINKEIIKTKRQIDPTLKCYSSGKKTIRIKIFNKILKNQHVKLLSSYDDFMKPRRLDSVNFKWRCLDCNYVFYGQYEKGHGFNSYEGHKIPFYLPARCPMCYPNLNVIRCASNIEKDFAKWCKVEFNNYDVINNKVENWKIIQSKQLDIILKNKNTKNIDFAIEFNGLYWHSMNEHNSDINKQLRKTLLCESKNISLIHITDYDWTYDKEHIKCFIKDIINKNIDFKKYQYQNNIIKIPRDKFNKTYMLNYKNFSLIGELPVELHIIDNLYQYPDAGYLLYKIN